MSIKKISQMTGASQSTVGRVLSDPDHRCRSEGLKERILAAAREINYIPNEAAKNLRYGGEKRKEPHRISILLTRVVSEENDPFFNEMLRLVELELRKNNCIVSNVWYNTDLFVEKTNTDMEAVVEKLYLDKRQEHNGLIVLGKCSLKALRALKKHEKNIVSINRNSTNFEVDEVFCDGTKIAFTAVDYLVSLGHRKIGYIGDCHDETRYTGYQQALMKSRINSDIDYVFDTISREENGFKAMEYFAHLGEPPTGIYCANDILAVGALNYFSTYKNNYYRPSVISSDDIVEAQYTTPMLTTVSLPKEEMARLAVLMLEDRINGGHNTVSRLEFDTRLVIRESVRDVNLSNEPEYYI